MKLNTTYAALLIGLVTPVFAQHTSPYKGQEGNEIKSLSPQEVSSLLTGQGMGYAKAAELNGYPGPAHVIELADQLALSSEQRQSSQRLMDQHKETARRIGAELISAERELDRLFAERRANAAAVSAATQRIGLLQAQLRSEHLNTHLMQTAVLNAEQIRRYNELRGYASTGDTTKNSQSHKHSKSH
jgi:Spy/CpxP family protein refolding chaperone